MTDGALTAEQAAVLAESAAALQRGDPAAAIDQLSPLLRSGCRDVDILLTYSVACQQAGHLEPAEGAAKVGLQESPERADLWAQLGILLDQSGRPREAIQMLERAVSLEPEKSSYWYNLGVAALSAMSPAEALRPLSRAVDIEPQNPGFWSALGLAQQMNGDVEQSEESLRKALELGGHQVGVIHNLAATLRILDRSEEALVLMNEAETAGSMPPQSIMLRADLLNDVGDYDEAVRAYGAVIREDPGAIDAHETLARLLPQLDRASEQLSAYGEALRRAPTLELYNSALRTAWELKDASALRKWSSEALKRFGELPDLRLMQALAHGLAGETGKAAELLEQLIAVGFAPALVQGAHHRLKLGDLGQAESHALLATRANPADQSAWAYLTVIWRLMEDEREQWVADYDRLVMPVDLRPPEGFDTIAAFMNEIASALHPLHGTLRHPTDQSLRQGTQTRGHLFEKRDSWVRQLGAIVEQAITDTIGQLSADRSHPFLARNTGRTKFLGSWSVRLAKGGFHLSHMHPDGWLSSALYVALPSEVRAPADGSGSPGSLTFGVPERELGLDLAPRRIEIPKLGRLILFPSYFWHGTIPFESDEYRLTVAFDAAPA